ncbi:MAG: hypothetical protein D6680_20555 [Cyanobacteria bacterium J007]|nr:MAG: hypothetical protein D6680_20555 [Cyanobacteria bacterium J007]
MTDPFAIPRGNQVHPVWGDSRSSCPFFIELDRFLDCFILFYIFLKLAIGFAPKTRTSAHSAIWRMNDDRL